MKTIGVIGLGSIGMRHAKNLKEMGHQILVCDPNLDNIPHPFMSRETFYGVTHDIDGLIIASPTQLHAAHIAEAKEAAVSNIFVEKPIGASDKHVDILINCFGREMDGVAMVGNNLRFHNCVKYAREWLKEGLIGKPLWASFAVSQYNDKYKEPCILNWGAHEVDLALHLLGPATVTGAAGNDQYMDVLCLHEYGVPSHIHVDYLAPIERRGFCIVGTDGNIEIDLVGRTGWIRDNVRRKYWITSGRGSWNRDYKDEMQAFIDLIDGKPVPYAATGKDGLAALELILEAQRMAK